MAYIVPTNRCTVPHHRAMICESLIAVLLLPMNLIYFIKSPLGVHMTTTYCLSYTQNTKQFNQEKENRAKFFKKTKHQIVGSISQ